MNAAENNLGDNFNAGFKTARLNLGNGWVARVALADSAQNPITPNNWADCLKDPDILLDQPCQTIKSNVNATVFVKNLKITDKTHTVIVKNHLGRTSFKNLCRSFLRTKAIRNFNTAVKLYENNIPTAYPLAALRQRKGPFTTRSIYITEYIQNSDDLYLFLRDNLVSRQSNNCTIKKVLAGQIAQIFASLHKASFRHRDAKASNFIVQKNSNSGIKTFLIDMDGIKPYRLQCRAPGRSFARLAASLLWNRAIYTTDYLRTFTIYSNLVGLDKSKQRQAFTDLARRSAALRLLKMAVSAMNNNESKK